MRKEKEGVVVSDKMDKTVVVSAESITTHPLYKKIIKKRKKFVADDPQNKAKKGNIVRIKETRPLSKTKRWQVVEILDKSKGKE